MEEINKALNKLIIYVESENYKGYDPYDIENTILPIKKLPHPLRFVLTQINKRSPINFRPILGIKKNYHTKGMGLLLKAYCNLYKINKEDTPLQKANQIFYWLKNNNSDYSKNLSWGFDYSYSSRNSRVEKGFPTVIHHNYVLNGLFSYYLQTNNNAVKDLLLKADDFITKDIPFITYSEGICFGYNPEAKGCCYNASLHAAEALSMVNYFKGKENYLELIHDAVQYVISRQKFSGVWYYSHGSNPQKEKKQIDFHQGFIIESLDKIDKFTNGKLSSLIRPALELGLDYYYKEQFDNEGRSIWRHPKNYPIDIHNQAQGLIIFSRFSHYNKNYKLLADKIAHWTINNMQDKKGFFYYQKYPLFTNKISHIRWGQAWMFYALTEYLLSKKK